MSEVKLKIDIRGGTIEIETNGDMFDAVFEKASVLLDKFQKIEIRAAQPSAGPTGSSNDELTGAEEPNDSATSKESKKAKRKGPGTAKTPNWKLVDNLLNEAQRDELKAFYSEKAPSNQNEQVAVLAVKLKELTGRDGFDGNEIYTAFHVVGKKTPGNLNAVFGNMAAAGLGSQVDKKYKPNFKAGDLVRHELPPKKKADQ